ncbi:hypothetical protein ElyMa_005365500 [Elysia marginata]|uniref:Uncharacterized protein n=1 Tax=Elysia marginata TaxID=1093978 RepID=A0AAV4ECB2_9GAST|nr:hypothetical protein ElyMa_005365500 [Elysia marginata]
MVAIISLNCTRDDGTSPTQHRVGFSRNKPWRQSQEQTTLLLSRDVLTKRCGLELMKRPHSTSPALSGRPLELRIDTHTHTITHTHTHTHTRSQQQRP